VADNVTQAKPDTDTHKQRLRRIRSNMRRRVDLKRCEEVRKEKPTTPDPFSPSPVFHFVAHLWPKPDRWRWHVEHWNRVAESINGQSIVYVATDPSTDEFETVTAMLSPNFEAVHVRNNAAGESPSFRDALKRIPSGPDDVLLYAHGKGMQDHTFASPAVRLWTELMYETVIHNRGRIEQKLSEGYRSFGSFRAFGRAPLAPKHRWHYAGTFFAIRMKHVTSFHVKQQYGGVEAWPGDQFPPEFAWVEFADCRNIMSHYSVSELTTPEMKSSIDHWRRKYGETNQTTEAQMNLTEAANKCNCDKGTTFSECHGYTKIYEECIPKICRMLEIGIGVGASSDMWKLWSTDIDVTYLDIDPDCVESERRKGRKAYVCDQSSLEALQDVATSIGIDRMDVIIDDGSHHPDHQILTLETLWRCLKPGGQFFIEDLHTSVWYPEEIRAHKRIDSFAKQQAAKLEYFCSGKLARVVKPAS
jgi:SAM-dependent methyltransferase